MDETKANSERLARLTNEADQSAVPALAMLVTSALLVLTLGVAVLQAAPVDAQLPEPDPQSATPAA